MAGEAADSRFDGNAKCDGMFMWCAREPIAGGLRSGSASAARSTSQSSPWNRVAGDLSGEVLGFFHIRLVVCLSRESRTPTIHELVWGQS